MEAATGAFFWADLVESTRATCYILHPYKFKIIRDSWNKTDKQDARNMVKALWVSLVTGEFGIPTVYKPSVTIRELRRLFSQYYLLNRKVILLKNTIQAILADNSISLTYLQKTMLSSNTDAIEMLSAFDLSPASWLSIQINLELLWKVEDLMVGSCEKAGRGGGGMTCDHIYMPGVKIMITFKKTFESLIASFLEFPVRRIL